MHSVSLIIHDYDINVQMNTVLVLWLIIIYCFVISSTDKATNYVYTFVC